VGGDGFFSKELACY